jgi:cytochrome oxidase assembly protein ShyY1
MHAAEADWAALRYLPVAATGEFVASRQILIDNKVHGGRAGYDVVTPLVLADGRAVLVDRGWVPQLGSRSQLPDVSPPSGVVTVKGRIELPSSSYLELRRETPSGALWQNLDPGRYAAATGMRVLPVVIEAADASPPDDGLLREWPLPDFGAERHRIYMVQWYAFGALALGLWLWFNRPRAAARVPMVDIESQRNAIERPKRAGGGRIVALIAALSLAPIAAAFVVYFFFPRPPAANYGKLLRTEPAPVISGMRTDGSPFRLGELHGRWVLLFVAPAGCSTACERAAYATRQARTMQGKDQDRIVRVLLVADDAAPPPALPAHTDLIVVRVAAKGIDLLPGGPDALYVIDPLGNLVLRYPTDPDIRGIANDLTRLLKASRIG